MGNKRQPDGTVCQNRKARFRFHIMDMLECGIVLVGTEVKSLRDHGASLDEAYARIDNNELWLIKFRIAPYRFGPVESHDPTRRRKLLVRASELRKWRPKVEQRGLTLVPVRVYFSERGLAKVTIALAQGKTSWDKRETLKSRDHRREMDREAQRPR